jgi:WXG100 family type VII secretion target
MMYGGLCCGRSGGEIVALVKVTSEELASVSSQLSAGSQEIDSQLTSMCSFVQSPVAAAWQGAASSSFESLYQEWHTSAANRRQALNGIAKLLSTAAASYAPTEQQIQQSVHQ